MNYTAYYKSPIGIIELSSTNDHIIGLYFKDEIENTFDKIPDILQKGLLQIDEFFNKKRKHFDLPLFVKGTEFQNKVWNYLPKITYGKTASYLDIAKAVANEKSTRAVGNANGKNPISIIIPCHRIIGSSGQLTGYGGGLWRKKWLLEFEMNNLQLF